MNRFRKLAGFPRNTFFHLIPNPNEPRRRLSRVFPELEFTYCIAYSLVLNNIELLKVTDILIYNFHYSEENFESTLCYFPCSPTMVKRSLDFCKHELSHFSEYKQMEVRHHLSYLALVEYFRNNI